MNAVNVPATGAQPQSCSGRPNQATGRAVDQYSINYLIIKRVCILLLVSAEGFSVKFTHSLVFEYILFPPLSLFHLLFICPCSLFFLFNFTRVPFFSVNAVPGRGSYQDTALTSHSFPNMPQETYFACHRCCRASSLQQGMKFIATGSKFGCGDLSHIQVAQGDPPITTATILCAVPD